MARALVMVPLLCAALVVLGLAVTPLSSPPPPPAIVRGAPGVGATAAPTSAGAAHTTAATSAAPKAPTPVQALTREPSRPAGVEVRVVDADDEVALVRGVVTGPGGPVAGASVSLGHADFQCDCQPRRVTSDACGVFVIEGHLSGTYVLGAMADGDSSLLENVRLEAGQTLERAVTLHPFHDLTIDLRGCDGAPAKGEAEVRSGGRLIARGPGWATSVWVPADQPLELVVRSGALRGEALVPPGAARVEVTLEPPRRLTGRVLRTGPADRDLIDVWYFPRDRHGAVDRGCVSRVTARDDAFELEVMAGVAGQLVACRRGESVSVGRRVEPDEPHVVVALPVTGRVAWAGEAKAEVFATCDGRSFKQLGAGSFEVGWVDVFAFRHDEGLAAATCVEVRAAVTNTVTVTLAPAARVRGRAVDRARRPAPTWAEVAGTRRPTRADGRFDLALPPGRWHVVATGAGLELVPDRQDQAPPRSVVRVLDITGPGQVDLGDVVLGDDQIP